MARNLLVATNPKRRTSAKQRAAARRNIKKAQAARRRKTRSASPRRRTRANPKRRTVARRRASSPRRTRRTYRNPARMKLIPRNLVDRQLIPALLGGGGAVANDIAYSFLMGKLPATGGTAELVMQLQTGPLRHAGKALSALALAYLASFAVNRRTAENLGAGALTVVGYNVVRDVMAKVAPDLNLGAYIDPGMGAYIEPVLGYAGAGRGASAVPLRAVSNQGKSAGLAKYSRRLRGIPGTGVTIGRQLTQAMPFGAKSAADTYSDAY